MVRIQGEQHYLYQEIGEGEKWFVENMAKFCSEHWNKTNDIFSDRLMSFVFKKLIFVKAVLRRSPIFPGHPTYPQRIHGAVYRYFRNKGKNSRHFCWWS